MKKSLSLVLALMLVFSVSTVAVAGPSGPSFGEGWPSAPTVSELASSEGTEDTGCVCEPFLEVRLLVGQHMEVGTVSVTNNENQICVTYALDEDALEDGWLIYETHLAIGKELSDIPQTPGNKWGTNPIPGQFEFRQYFEEGVPEWTECIDFKDDWDFCDDLFIAAHAVIMKVDCEVLAEAPYGGSRVVEYDQGLRYDYTAVRTQRSNPDAALTFTTGNNEANFFSLGFREDREEYPDADDAWIIIEFDYPVLNGAGSDLQVIEDTWGLPYPAETADVWVSQNGAYWIYLGKADNQNPVSQYHTITDFDLENAGLDYVSFVKIQDTSVRSDFANLYPGQGATLDGYDLNAVVALQDHKLCDIKDETAWGEGDRFNEKGNWGMYFMYKLCEPDNGNGECETETAWGGATEGEGSAWWYYFDTSGDAAQTLWAGQTKNAGTVTVSAPVDNQVTITITFNEGWGLQDVNEPVKIQGYDEGGLPASRPPAGQFTTYKGDELEVTVLSYDFYAIHLDAQYCE